MKCTGLLYVARSDCINVTLAASRQYVANLLVKSSASFSTEISVGSPQKLFINIIYKTSFLDQSIQKLLHLILKTEALVGRGFEGGFIQSLKIRLVGSEDSFNDNNLVVRFS